MRKLIDLEIGESGILVALDLPPGVQNHLMYMGFVPEAHVRVLHRSPMGDPTVYAVDGIEVALRRDTAKAIRVAEVAHGVDGANAVTVTRPAPADQLEHQPELIEAGR